MRRTLLSIAALMTVNHAALAQPNVVVWGPAPYAATNVPPDLTNAIAVAAGGYHNLALRADGTVVAWGANTVTQTNVPAGLSNVVAIAATAVGSLALKADGTVVTWGMVPGGPANEVTNMVSVSGSGGTAYVLSSDGSPRTWDNKSEIVAGLGNATSIGAAGWGITTVNGTTLPQDNYPTLPDMTFVQVLNKYGPALTVDGRVSVYGSSFQDAGLSNIVAISAWGTGSAQYLGLRSNGTIYNGPTYLSNVVAIACSSYQRLALIGAGPPFFGTRPMDLSINPGRTAYFYLPATGEWPIAYQWHCNGVPIPGATTPMLAVTNVGAENFGAYTVVASNVLGVTTSPARNLALLPIVGPDWSPNITDVVSVASSTRYGGLALQRSGQAIGWGVKTSSSDPTVPPGISNVVAVSTSSRALYSDSVHGLALTSSGVVYSWGRNSFTNTWPTLTNIASVSAGWMDVGLRQDGRVMLWNTSFTPGLNSALENIVEAVAATSDYAATLYLRADGTVYDSGGFGVPPGPSNVVSVAYPGRSALALTADGTVVAWSGTPTLETNVPPGLTNVLVLTSGRDGSRSYILALKADGTLAAWGDVSSYISNLVATVTNAVMVDGAFALLGSGQPFLVTPLVDRAAPNEGQVFFRALATGERPLHYQWQFNGLDLPGRTNNILHLANLLPSQSGLYSVVVTNTRGATVSRASRLTVHDYAAAADNSDITWTSFGDAIWFPQTNVTHDGVSAVQSGPVSSIGKSAHLRGTVTGPGTLRFWWKISGDAGSDWLSFYLNESAGSLLRVTGETDWEQVTVYLGPGPQILDWVCRRLNYAPGQVGAWVDEVSFTPGFTAPTITEQPISQSQAPGGEVIFRVANSGTPAFYQWRLNGEPISGAIEATITVTNVGPAKAGAYSVIVSNIAGADISSNALLVLGRVACWGRYPWLPPAVTNAIALASDSSISLALQPDGTVLAWRVSGLTSVPETLTNVSAIAAGSGIFAAVNAADGTVAVWGRDYYDERTNVPPGLSNVLMVAGGSQHVAALVKGGTVVCWGSNDYGQTNVPPGLTNLVYVSANGGVTFALRSDGTVAAWGDNYDRVTNVPPDLGDVVSVSYGLALRGDGSVFQWGRTNYGVPPAGLSNVVQVASALGKLALTEQGKVISWGIGDAPPETLAMLSSVAPGSYGGFGIVTDVPPSRQIPVAAPQVINGSFQVTVPTVCARVYRLEYKNDLTDSVWQTLPLVAGDGHEQDLVDATPITNQRFYRVRRW